MKYTVQHLKNYTVKASKFCMILRLDLNNSFLKFGIFTTARSTNCRLLKKVLKWLYFEGLSSCMTETYAKFILVSLLPWCTVSYLQLLWLQIYHDYDEIKKNIFISFKLQKQRHQNFGCKLFGTWAYLAPNLMFQKCLL